MSDKTLILEGIDVEAMKADAETLLIDLYECEKYKHSDKRRIMFITAAMMRERLSAFAFCRYMAESQGYVNVANQLKDVMSKGCGDRLWPISYKDMGVDNMRLHKEKCAGLLKAAALESEVTLLKGQIARMNNGKTDTVS